MSERVDFKRALPGYRARRGRFDIIEIPDMRYLMIDGHGDPNTAPAFDEAVRSLYPMAYTLKFTSKRDLGRDYVVPPLEGLWWSDDMDTFTGERDKSRWSWTLLSMVPGWIDDAVLTSVRDEVAAKDSAPRIDEIRLQTLSEGCCVQTLHVGSYDDEAPVLAQMHDAFIPAHGLRMTGVHHEIYLGDPRRTAPERRRTILRQPVRPSGEPV